MKISCHKQMERPITRRTFFGTIGTIRFYGDAFVYTLMTHKTKKKVSGILFNILSLFVLIVCWFCFVFGSAKHRITKMLLKGMAQVITKMRM